MTLVTLPLAKSRHLSLRVKRAGDRRSLSRSATRALDVMEAFGEARCPLRAVDIARLLDLSPSSANQLLKTMVESAHLVFDARGKTYLPSPRLGGFGHWITEIYSAGGKVGDLVRDVRERTGLVVTVTTPNDLFMQIIDSAAPAFDVAERGMQVSLFGTAIGSAYLSTLPECEILRLADRARIPETEMPGILEMIAQMRLSGYADGPSHGPDIWSIALPLPNAGFCVPAVLGLAGPADTVCSRLTEYHDIMRAAIARWSTAVESKQAIPQEHIGQAAPQGGGHGFSIAEM